MATQPADSGAEWSGHAVVLSGVVTLALVLYGVLRFPESRASGGSTSFLVTVAGVTAYIATALWARRSSSADARVALRIGATIGAAIAGVAAANHTLELWATLPASIGSVLGAGMWGLTFLGFGMACSITMARRRPFVVGLLASAWSAMVMAILLVAFALAVGFAFMPHMQDVLSAPYAASGMTDVRAFVTRHLIGSASSHLSIAPTVAVLVGTLSAAAFRLLGSLERRLAILSTCVAALLLVAGAASIAHATGIERSQRPPFIRFGLASLAIALVSAHPLVVALRHEKRVETLDERTA